jgi:hypothetical protein
MGVPMLQIPDVHTKRLLDLADFLENLEPEQFSMRQWGQHSEPRCICGWLLHNEGYHRMDDWAHAAAYLGLDDFTACKLFAPENEWSNDRAARALRELAVTS